MKVSGRDLAVSAGLALVTIVQIGWLAHIAPFNMGDEGYLFYIAWRVQEGARLFEDVELFTYAPGLFQLWAAWFDMFGATVASGRALGVLLAAMNIVLGYAVARVLGARLLLAALVAGVILLTYPWLFRGHILLLGEAALLLSLLTQRVPGRLPLAGLGAVVVIGAAVRIDAAGAAGALALASVLLRMVARRSLPGFAMDILAGFAGAAVAGTAVVIAFANAGVLEGWLQQLAGFASFAHSRSVAWYKMPFPAFGGPGSDLLIVLMISAAIWPLVGLAAARRRRGPGASEAWRTLTLLSLFAISNLPQFLIERPDGAHFADRAFAVVLLLTGLMVLGEPTRLWRVLRASAGIWMLALVVWSARDPGALNGYSLRPTLTAQVGGETVRLPPNTELRDALLHLDRHLRPEEPLATLPFAPGANFLLKRPTPSPQVNFFPYHQQRVDSEQALRRGLASPALRYVLLQPHLQMSPDPRANLACYAPRIMADLRGFRRISGGGNWWLLERGGQSVLPAGECRPR